MTANLFNVYVEDEEDKARWCAQRWVRRNTLESLRIAVKSADLNSENTAELMKLIDAELARIGGTL